MNKLTKLLTYKLLFLIAGCLYYQIGNGRTNDLNNSITSENHNNRIGSYLYDGENQDTINSVLVKPLNYSFISDSAYLWFEKKGHLNLLTIPLNKAHDLARQFHPNSDVPLITNTIIKYSDSPNFEIWGQKYFSSFSYNTIGIFTRFRYGHDEIKFKSILEIYNREGDLLWIKESGNFIVLDCMLPDKLGNIGILWHIWQDDDYYGKNYSNLSIYNSSGDMVKKIEDVTSVERGFLNENIYYKKEYRIKDLVSNKNTLFYYNLQTGIEWSKTLPFDTTFYIYPVSSNGMYIVCNDRNKILKINNTGDILLQQEYKNPYNNMKCVSRDGKYIIYQGANKSIILANYLNGEIILTKQYSEYSKDKYWHTSSTFIENGFAMAFTNMSDRKIKIVLFDFSGTEMGYFILNKNSPCHNISIIEEKQNYILYIEGERTVSFDKISE